MILVLDVVWIVLFAVLGRRSHGADTALMGVVQTAGPFLAGYLVALLALRLPRAPTALGRGAAAVAITLILGMAIRTVLYGRIPDPAFIAVATGMLVLGMIGWRLIVRLVERRRAPAA